MSQSHLPIAATFAPELLPWARIVYSSRTGNTRMLAEHLAGVFSLGLFDAAEELAAYRRERDEFGPARPGDVAGAGDEVLLLGFWTWRGGPNPSMRDYMYGLRGRRVFLFGTMAAWPDSAHARGCLEEARYLLDAGRNVVLGSFVCQGRLAPSVRAKSRHPLTPERVRRLDEAEKHPDMSDLAALEAAAHHVLSDLIP